MRCYHCPTQSSLGQRPVKMKSLCVLAVVLLALCLALPPPVRGCDVGFSQLAGRCLQVVIAAGPVFSGRFAVQWQKARDGCQALKADLAVLDDPALVEELNEHILKHVSLSGEYAYWVGGHKVNGVWQWVNNRPINLSSNLWVPNQPKKDSAPAAAILVPADSEHGRLYLNQGNPKGQLPAYICEAQL